MCYEGISIFYVDREMYHQKDYFYSIQDVTVHFKECPLSINSITIR